MKKTTGMDISVKITDNIFDSNNDTLAKVLSSVGGEGFKIALVADANVVNRTPGLGSAIGKYLQTYGLSLAASPTVIAAGEKIKVDDFLTARHVASALIDARVGINDVVLVIGGGSLFDVTSWAAAQVRGGLKVVRVPTTPASMIDAAFSTTGALDSQSVKDAYTVASVPSAVVIDVAFAKTVLDGVWRGGYGEAVRLAAVTDASLMKKLAKNAAAFRERDLAVFKDTVESCYEVRAKKGSGDFALWSARRLESMSSYKLPHGYSVPIGICIDCAYSVEKGLLKEEYQEIICRTLADCGALDGLSHSRHLLAQAEGILRGLDARVLTTGGQAIVVPTGLGKSTVVEVPDRDALRKVLGEFLKEASEPDESSAE